MLLALSALIASAPALADPASPLWTGAIGSVSGEPARVIDAADPGVPAAIVVRAPPEWLGAGALLVDALAEWLRARSDLEPRSAEQAGLDRDGLAACGADELFSCLVRGTAASSARWLFLASLRAEGGQRASATVFVLDLADVQDGDDEDTIYGRLAVVRVSDVTSEGAPARVGEALDRELAARLDRGGRLDPFGEILLSSSGVGPLAIELDGRPIGTYEGAPVLVRRARAGSRRLTVGGASVTVSVSPRARASATIIVEDIVGGVRWGLWSSVAVASAGVAVLVAGVADSSSSPRVACVRRASESCETAAPLGPPTVEPVSGASPWVGVGMGVAALGTSWLVGALLDDDDPAARWGLTVGVGLGAAMAVVGLSL